MYSKWVLLFFITCINIELSCGQVPVKAKVAVQQQTASQPVTGILGAFGDEITFLLTQVEQKKEVVIQQTIFTTGILKGRNVIVAQTGIGKVNAAITTTLMLEHFQPAQIVFTGIAGAVSPQLQPGDLVIASKVAYHDYGTLTADSMLRRRTRNPITMQENPLYFPCDTGLMRLSSLAAKLVTLKKTGAARNPPNIITGIIVTGDVFVSSEKATQDLLQKMNAVATEMEGAAVAQVCWQQQVPFIVIRSMSDNANSNAHTDVASFYRVAAYNSATLVMALTELIAVQKR